MVWIFTGEIGVEDLQRWLLDELRTRNQSYREFSLAAGLDHGAVSRYLAGTRPIRESCEKLATYTGVSLEQVLIMAGHLKAPADYDPFLDEVTEVTRGFEARDKEAALQFLRLLREQLRPRG
jgi:transcriptional regulator with XRE-family HTH domain